eukprot:RCo000365
MTQQSSNRRFFVKVPCQSAAILTRLQNEHLHGVRVGNPVHLPRLLHNAPPCLREKPLVVLSGSHNVVARVSVDLKLVVLGDGLLHKQQPTWLQGGGKLLQNPQKILVGEVHRSVLHTNQVVGCRRRGIALHCGVNVLCLRIDHKEPIVGLSKKMLALVHQVDGVHQLQQNGLSHAPHTSAQVEPAALEPGLGLKEGPQKGQTFLQIHRGDLRVVHLRLSALPVLLVVVVPILLTDVLLPHRVQGVVMHAFRQVPPHDREHAPCGGLDFRGAIRCQGVRNHRVVLGRPLGHHAGLHHLQVGQRKEPLVVPVRPVDLVSLNLHILVLQVHRHTVLEKDNPVWGERDSGLAQQLEDVFVR